MEPLAFHLVFRSVDGRVLAPDVRAQRAVAEVCHAVGEPRGLLAFRASGDHLHLQAACEREEAGKLARVVAGTLTRRLDLPGFAPAHLTACADQRHLEEAFYYVLRNAEKHGVTGDPLHEASSIGALLGLRMAPGSFLARVRRAVPTLDRSVLLAVLGVRVLDEAFQLEQLADAAAGAVGLAALDQSALAVEARGAATRVGGRFLSLEAVADVLGISARTARRCRAAPATPLLERAIGLRMGLRAALGDRARLDLPVAARAPYRRGRAGLLASAGLQRARGAAVTERGSSGMTPPGWPERGHRAGVIRNDPAWMAGTRSPSGDHPG